MDPYEVLGCTPFTPLGEVETKYKLLLRRHHPDLHQAEGPDAVAAAERTTRQLNVAIGSIRREHQSRHRRDSGFSRDYEQAYARAHEQNAQPDDEQARRAAQWVWGEPIRHDPNEAVPCPYCGRGFFDLDDFTVHLTDTHHLHDKIAPRPRKEPADTAMGRAAAKLRLVPASFVALVLMGSLAASFPAWFTLTTAIFLVIVLWAQTTHRTRRRSLFDLR